MWSTLAVSNRWCTFILHINSKITNLRRIYTSCIKRSDTSLYRNAFEYFEEVYYYWLRYGDRRSSNCIAKIWCTAAYQISSSDSIIFRAMKRFQKIDTGHHSHSGQVLLGYAWTLVAKKGNAFGLSRRSRREVATWAKGLSIEYCTKSRIEDVSCAELPDPLWKDEENWSD